MLVPDGLCPPCFPVTYTIWLPASLQGTEHSLEAETSFQQHQVLKPKPGSAKERVNMDELVGMSQLSIGMSTRHETETFHSPSPLSLKIRGEPSRPSAFHSNGSVSSSDLSKGNSAIQAIWTFLLVIQERSRMVLTPDRIKPDDVIGKGGNKPRHKPLEFNVLTKKERTYQAVKIELPFTKQSVTQHDVVITWDNNTL